MDRHGRIRLGACLAVVLLGWLAMAGPAFAEEEFWPQEMLFPGLKGICKTVIEGEAIEELDVEVVAVLPNQGPAGDLVLVRLGGPLVDKMGGVGAGMSGSPIFFQGKLAGAIGYGFDYTDHRLALMTPIQDMLPLLDYLPRPMEKPLEQEIPYAPYKTPLLVSGFSSRAQGNLQSILARKGFDMLSLPAGGPVSSQAGSLEPGSAFAVQLMRGDLNMSALGTITYVKDGQFLALGHPFLNKGDVNLLLSGARIHRSVPSLSLPFKLGSPTMPLGTVYQDRSAGLAGRIGTLPPMIELEVETKDKDRGLSRVTRAEIVGDSGLSLSLIGTGLLSALDKGIDRIGPGTAWVEMRLEAEGIPAPLVRKNMFYSSTDISAQALMEAVEAAYLVQDNIFEPVTMKGIYLKASIQQSRETAQVIKAIPAKEKIHPGESTEVEIVLRPFRQPPKSIRVELEVPADAQPGMLPVTVRGGGSYYYYYLEDPFHDLEPIDSVVPSDGEWSPPTNLESFEKLLHDFTDRETNNELIVEYLPFYETYGEMEAFEAPESSLHSLTGGSEGGSKSSRRKGTGEEKDESLQEDREPVRIREATDYVVEGSQTFELLVELPEEEADLPRIQPREEFRQVK
ncbi:MAG: hypothetical protein GX980_10070 [Firmicutes bacterium]|nr:hypothetical protein [Bacillota bacterium]